MGIDRSRSGNWKDRVVKACKNVKPHLIQVLSRRRPVKPLRQRRVDIRGVETRIQLLVDGRAASIRTYPANDFALVVQLCTYTSRILRQDFGAQGRTFGDLIASVRHGKSVPRFLIPKLELMNADRIGLIHPEFLNQGWECLPDRRGFIENYEYLVKQLRSAKRAPQKPRRWGGHQGGRYSDPRHVVAGLAPKPSAPVFDNKGRQLKLNKNGQWVVDQFLLLQAQHYDKSFRTLLQAQPSQAKTGLYSPRRGRVSSLPIRNVPRPR